MIKSPLFSLRYSWRKLQLKLKAKLRDWLFSDYKWITRAQVQGVICCKMWEHREDSVVNARVRKALMEVREDIEPALRTRNQAQQHNSLTKP